MEEELRRWKRSAEDTQKNFAAQVYNDDNIWREHQMPVSDRLWIQIATEFFGQPPGENYPREQMKIVDDLKRKCVDYSKRQGSNKVSITFIHVCAYKPREVTKTYPIIRLKKGDGTDATLSFFLDHTGRVYDSWRIFLNENVFNGHWICVPEDGEYTYTDSDRITVRVSFYDQTLRVADKGSAFADIVIMFGGSVMMLNPPFALLGAGFVMVGAMSGLNRSAETLWDRSRHGQSINPLVSGKALSSWLMAAGSTCALRLSVKFFVHSIVTEVESKD